MAYRATSAARSEISSAVSDHGDSASQWTPQMPPLPTTQQGYIHLSGIMQPTNRSVRSPPPPLSTMTGGSSRPGSPMNQTARTHVPSITAQGFFKPMSSRKLQAQRLGRIQQEAYVPPSSSHQSEGFDDSRSVTSSRRGPYASLPRGHRPTPSVTTAYSESEVPDLPTTRGYNLGSDYDQRAFGAGAAYSRDNHAPHPLTLEGVRGTIPEEAKTPRSFRSGLSFGRIQVIEPGHQHLPSTASTPPQREKPLSKPFPNVDLGKNYEYFEGNTIFWMGGRLQNTRDRPINISTGVFIVLPTILYFVFSASWLWHRVSPALPIIYAYLFFICFSSFIHASLVDPGIIPRNIHPFPPDSEDPLAVGPPTNDWVVVRLAGSEDAAMDVPVKYCKTCNIWRPPRCYHCRVCDNCIETLDHHCVWLNNCVGRRNYRYFFTFISSGTVLALYLAFSSLGHVLSYSSQEGVPVSAAISACRVPFAMFIYGLLALAYPAALLGYHLMLTGRGETTREYLSAKRFPKNERLRPFSLGNIFRNWVAVLGRPRPPTYLHFKKYYEEGDQRFGSRKGQRQARLDPEAQGGGLEMKPVKGFEGPHSRKKEAR